MSDGYTMITAEFTFDDETRMKDARAFLRQVLSRINGDHEEVGFGSGSYRLQGSLNRAYGYDEVEALFWENRYLLKSAELYRDFVMSDGHFSLEDQEDGEEE